MTTKLFTFAEMADQICTHDGRTDNKAVLEQIRGFYQRGLLNPASGVARLGRGAPVRVTLKEFCRLRLLLVLLDLGVRGDDLARANVLLDDGGRRTFPDGKTIVRSLSTMIEGVGRGEGWVLSGGTYADGDGTHASYRLVRDWEANAPFTAENTYGDPMLGGSAPILRAFTVYSQVKIPASDLIAPLLDA